MDWEVLKIVGAVFGATLVGTVVGNVLFAIGARPTVNRLMQRKLPDPLLEAQKDYKAHKADGVYRAKYQNEFRRLHDIDNPYGPALRDSDETAVLLKGLATRLGGLGDGEPS